MVGDGKKWPRAASLTSDSRAPSVDTEADGTAKTPSK